MKNILVLSASILLSLVNTLSYGQKLPAKQDVSIYAPKDIKIDGKSTEWQGKFKAYNASNHIFYTISNDDKNIYLIVYSREYLNLDKIIYGGVTFIMADLNEKNKQVSSIAYPIASLQKTTPIARTAYEYHFNLKNQAGVNKEKIDNLKSLINTRVENTYKEILIKGLKGLTEPSISIYNEDGVKVKLLFDSEIALTYEVAIPLKYLNFKVIDGKSKFKYNILLNGRSVPTVNANAPDAPQVPNSGGNYLDSPTDFSGEYTLAKN